MPTEPQSQPLVSIIVPVYNAADHIARCIESIRRQTYRNLEIILLNDGSKDVSYAVCQSYAGIDRRIVVIDKNNSGVSATRNLACRKPTANTFSLWMRMISSSHMPPSCWYRKRKPATPIW